MIRDRIELWIRLHGSRTKLNNWWTVPSVDRMKALLEIADIDYVYGRRLKVYYEYDGLWSYEWDMDDIIDELNIIMLLNGRLSLPTVHNVSQIELIDMMFSLSQTDYSTIPIGNDVLIRKD